MLGKYEKHQYMWFLAETLTKKLIPKGEKHNIKTFKRKYKRIYFVA